MWETQGGVSLFWVWVVNQIGSLNNFRIFGVLDCRHRDPEGEVFGGSLGLFLYIDFEAGCLWCIAVRILDFWISDGGRRLMERRVLSVLLFCVREEEMWGGFA